MSQLPAQRPTILSENANERMQAFFMDMVDILMDGLPPAKKFFANQFKNMFMDDFLDKIRLLNDEDVKEWAKKTKAASNLIYGVIEGTVSPDEIADVKLLFLPEAIHGEATE